MRFTTRKWPPAVGGMETYSVRMAEELARQCHLELITLAGRRDGRAPSFPALMGFGVSCALQIPFKRHVDVAHMGDMALWPLGFLELVFRRAERLVLSAHGSDVSLSIRPGTFAMAYRAYLKLGAKLLPDAKVIANSAYTADLAGAAGFRNVRVVPLGTDMRAVGNQRRDGLLFAGRISRAKGLRFLVEEVLPLLRTDIRLRVAGTVWEESERTLLGDPRVEYLGALNQEQLQAEYSRAQITLVPSQIAEGFGLVAIEAAACGSQVIASRAGGLMNLVEQPWGELIDCDDPVRWAGAIDARCNADSRSAAQISDAAIMSIESRFRWATVADQTLVEFAD